MKKFTKIASLLTAGVLVLGASAMLPVWAETAYSDTYEGYLNYSVSDNRVVITGLTQKSG